MNIASTKAVNGVVKSVVPLTENQHSRLLEKLESKFGTKIILEQQIDKSIIAGLYITVGNEIIDATIVSQYKEMKDLMLNRK